MTQNAYQSPDALMGHIHEDPRNIKERIKADSALIEGVHIIRPFGRVKILRIWVHIENDLDSSLRIYEMARVNRGVCHG
jgi:hypothetical protein